MPIESDINAKLTESRPWLEALKTRKTIPTVPAVYAIQRLRHSAGSTAAETFHALDRLGFKVA